MRKAESLSGMTHPLHPVVPHGRIALASDCSPRLGLVPEVLAHPLPPVVIVGLDPTIQTSGCDYGELFYKSGKL